jgi:hypothetical protein
MRDFKFRLLHVPANYREAMMNAPAQLKSNCLKPCCEAFVSNMDRTILIPEMPVLLNFTMLVESYLRALEMLKAAKAGDHDISLKSFMTRPVSDLTQNEASKQFATWTMQEQQKLRYQNVIFPIDALATDDPIVGKSMDALLTSVVLESWLFFEALASDLWAVGVDNGGKIISARTHANETWEKDREGMKAVKLPSSVQSNAKTHPGSFWTEVGFVSFQKLRSIRMYYKMAFGDRVEKILDESANGYINALSAVRNCITHSAGKVDAHFQKQASRFDEFKNLPVGEKLMLDGNMVSLLRDAAFQTGLGLVNFVDERLQAGD